MQSTAKNVNAYLDEAPAERRAALVRLRGLCCALLKGFEELMAYGGPCYSRNGEVEVGFGSQKNFIGLYILRLDVLDAPSRSAQNKRSERRQGCYPLLKAGAHLTSS